VPRAAEFVIPWFPMGDAGFSLPTRSGRDALVRGVALEIAAHFRIPDRRFQIVKLIALQRSKTSPYGRIAFHKVGFAAKSLIFND
jgi:hypothetical protein